MSGTVLDSLRPSGWDEYIGQPMAKQALEIMVNDLGAQMASAVAADKASGKFETSPFVQPVHILIVGPPGTGKTTLSKIYASKVSELAKTNRWPAWGSSGPGSIDNTVDMWTSGRPDAPYRYAELEGSRISDYKMLESYFAWLQVQGVLFVDEFQDVPNKIHSDFYLVMHDGKWRSASGELKKHYGFTIIGATTDDADIARPLLSRFGLIIRLKPYQRPEMKEIILRAADKLELKLSKAAVEVLVDRSRDNPRTAVQNVDMLKRLLRSNGEDSREATEAKAIEAAEIRDIGKYGLTSTDIAVLSLLREGPSGAKAIAETLNLGKERNYTDSIEPFLLQRGYIRLTPRGRIITSDGTSVLR